MKTIISVVLAGLFFSLCAVGCQAVNPASETGSSVSVSPTMEPESPIETEPVIVEDTPETLSPADSTPEPPEVTDATDEAEAAVSYEELYESVFEAYRRVMDIAPNDDAWAEIIEEDTYNLLSSADLEGGLYDLGYQLRDMNNDGIPELIIGKMGPSRYGGAFDNIIYAMFTLVEGEPYKLFTSWTRNSHFFSSLGDIYVSGSSGAMNSDYYICEFVGIEFHVIEGCWTDEIAFHTTDGDRFQANGEQISTDELAMYLEQYENSILPIGELKPIS